MTEPIEKIVICFRMPAEGVQSGKAAAGYLPRARLLAQRAEALGATLAAWSAVTMAFAFESDGLEEAVDLVATIAGEGVEPAARWASGIARGPMEPLGIAGAGARSDLAWGEALVLSLTLSRIARAGEVLVHPSAAATEGTLRLLETRAANDGGYEVRGMRLDVLNPWRTRPSVARMQAVRADASPLPATAAATRAPDGSLPLPALQARPFAAPAPLPAPKPPPRPSVTNEANLAVPVGPVNRELGQSPKPSPVTMNALAAPPPVPTPAASPPFASPAVAVAAPPLNTTPTKTRPRTSSILDWAERAESPTAAARLNAFVEIARGQSGPALRALEEARNASSGVARCQASLALAVALAGIGHDDDALLEGLDALARARDLGDAPAARACIRFLEQLAESRTATLAAAAAAELEGGADSDGVEVEFE